MISWFELSYSPSTLTFLIVTYNLIAAITSYDMQLLQEKRNPQMDVEMKLLPRWIGLVYWLETILFIFMLFLNWKFALVAWIMKSILQALFILNFIGYIIISPFRSFR